MDELTEPARRLIAAAMDEDVPAPEAADESWGVVVSRVVEVDAPPSVAPARTRATPWIVGGVVIVGAAIAIAMWPRKPSDGATPRAPVASPTSSTIPSSAPPPPPRARPATNAGPRPLPRAPAPILDAPASARLLDEAEAALASDPAAALALLERHAETADDGIPQRLALRIEALCALGRAEDARGEATAFLRRSDASPFAARVRASCGGPR